MFKCDKCGCEHNSRTVCPKCGAPVVIVNEDYLLRRQQWEEQQKNNLRYRKKGEDRGSSDIGRHNDSGRKKADDSLPAESGQTDIKDRILGFKNSVLSKLRDKRAADDEKRRKREKERNANELKDNRREQGIRQKRRRILAAVSVAAGAAVVVVGIFAGVDIYRSIDRSDLRYFDGHRLISVNDGVLLDLDRDGSTYSLLAYTPGLNAALLKEENEYIYGTGNADNIDNSQTAGAADGGGNTQNAGGAGGIDDTHNSVDGYSTQDGGHQEKAALIGWYEGSETALISDIGDITDEYAFSQSGRYLAYVLYSEPDERYSLAIYDLLKGSGTVYDTGRRVKIVAVADGGRVLFDELETGDYSTVVGTDLYVADLSEKLLIAYSVNETSYDERNDEAVFTQDDRLYVCGISQAVLDKYDDIISDREHIYVNEGVISVADDILGNAILYITESGLWVYENGYSYRMVGDVDTADEFYYCGKGELIYRRKDKLYYAKQDMDKVKEAAKSADGETPLDMQEALDSVQPAKASVVLENISGGLVSAEDGTIWCIAGDGGLFNSADANAAVDDGVTDCIRLEGAAGCAYTKDGKLITVYGKAGRNKTVIDNVRINAASGFSVISSQKSLYYVDSSSVLWKIDKNGKKMESLGFASLVGFFDN
ncbi:MAG: hypothetical protein ACLS55_09215 [Lachnospiraceae bacterium]